MKQFSQEHSIQYLRSLAECGKLWVLNQTLIFNEPSGVVIKIPEVTRQLLSLSTALAHELKYKERCLWMRTYYFSYPNFDSLRFTIQHFGLESSLFSNLPGTLFDVSDQNLLVDAIFLTLLLQWDAVFVSDEGDKVAILSHDEYLAFGSRDSSNVDRLKQETADSLLSTEELTSWRATTFLLP